VTAADAAVGEERVREALREVVDPCTAATGSHLDVVEMGLVADVDVDDGTVRVDLRLTTPACHMVPYFIDAIEEVVTPLPGVDEVAVATDDGTSWTEAMMTEEARRRRRSVLERHRSRATSEALTND
jgi:metal-sulfur cluster biosynthetic enzyme